MAKQSNPQKIERLSQFLRDERNHSTRSMTAAARNGLASGLTEFGDLGTIVFNTRLGKLVGGNQRVESLLNRYGELAVRTDPAGNHWIELPNGETVMVRFVDWPESRHAAAAITANNPALQGEFTDQAAEMLREVEAENIALFDELRMDVLAQSLPDSMTNSDKIRQLESENVPETTWALIGIPTVDFGLIAADLERIANLPGVFCEITANDHSASSYDPASE